MIIKFILYLLKIIFNFFLDIIKKIITVVVIVTVLIFIGKKLLF